MLCSSMSRTATSTIWSANAPSTRSRAGRTRPFQLLALALIKALCRSGAHRRRAGRVPELDTTEIERTSDRPTTAFLPPQQLRLEGRPATSRRQLPARARPTSTGWFQARPNTRSEAHMRPTVKSGRGESGRRAGHPGTQDRLDHTVGRVTRKSLKVLVEREGIEPSTPAL